jgi:transposase-like protein
MADPANNPSLPWAGMRRCPYCESFKVERIDKTDADQSELDLDLESYFCRDCGKVWDVLAGLVPEQDQS